MDRKLSYGLHSTEGRGVKNPSLIELAEICNAIYEDEDNLTVLTHAKIPPQTLALSLKPIKDFPLSMPSRWDTAVSTPRLAEARVVKRSEMREVPIQWTRKGKWFSHSGFFCALYIRASDGKAVVSFRGTDDLLDILLDDAEIALRSLPSQASLALQVMRANLPSNEIFLTGHSLGGALAIIAGAQRRIPVVTFNAPGITNGCIAANGSDVLAKQSGWNQFLRAVDSCVRGSRVRNICVKGDLVSNTLLTGFQPGARFEVNAPSCNRFNVLCLHAMQTC